MEPLYLLVSTACALSAQVSVQLTIHATSMLSNDTKIRESKRRPMPLTAVQNTTYADSKHNAHAALKELAAS
jgi:hypothetical protein